MPVKFGLKILTLAPEYYLNSKNNVRLLTFSNFNASSSPIFLDLKILKMSDLVKLLNIISIYNVLAKSSPPALNNIYIY